LTHAIIPLEQLEGWHWNLVRRLLAFITASGAYRRLEETIASYMDKIGGAMEEIKKKYCK